jgi:hypothetical protein
MFATDFLHPQMSLIVWIGVSELTRSPSWINEQERSSSGWWRLRLPILPQNPAPALPSPNKSGSVAFLIGNCSCQIFHRQLMLRWFLIFWLYAPLVAPEVLLCCHSNRNKAQQNMSTLALDAGRSGPARSSRYDWDRCVVRASRAPIGILQDI